MYEMEAVCMYGMDKKQKVTVSMKGIGKYSREHKNGIL